MMIRDVDIGGAAALMHRSRSWMQQHWRELVAGGGFPAPFVGGERSTPPWWRAAAIEAWKDGARFGEPGQGGLAGDLSTDVRPAQPADAAANDARPMPLVGRDRVNALLAAAGASAAAR